MPKKVRMSLDAMKEKLVANFIQELANEEERLIGTDTNTALPNIRALRDRLGTDRNLPGVFPLYNALHTSYHHLSSLAGQNNLTKTNKIVISHLETLSSYITKLDDQSGSDYPQELEDLLDLTALHKAFFLRLAEDLYGKPPLSEDMRVIVSVTVGAILGLASMAIFGVVPEALDFLSEIASFTGIPELGVTALTGVVNTAVGVAIGAGVGFFARHLDLDKTQRESRVRNENAEILRAIEPQRPRDPVQQHGGL